MNTYKVKVTCGAYDAPCIYVEAMNDNDAIAQAKKQSGLARFTNWVFTAKAI